VDEELDALEGNNLVDKAIRDVVALLWGPAVLPVDHNFLGFCTLYTNSQ